MLHLRMNGSQVECYMLHPGMTDSQVECYMLHPGMTDSQVECYMLHLCIYDSQVDGFPGEQGLRPNVTTCVRFGVVHEPSAPGKAKTGHAFQLVLLPWGPQAQAMQANASRFIFTLDATLQDSV